MGASMLGLFLFVDQNLAPQEKVSKWYSQTYPKGLEIPVDLEDDEEKELLTPEQFSAFYCDLFNAIENDTPRDVCYSKLPPERTFPEWPEERIIFFAGEMSWGDEPDGTGYNLIKKFKCIDLATKGELGKRVGAQ